MPDVVLKNASGEAQTYEGVEAVEVPTPEGGIAVFHSEEALTAGNIAVSNENVEATNVDDAITELAQRITQGGGSGESGDGTETALDAADVTYTPGTAAAAFFGSGVANVAAALEKIPTVAAKQSALTALQEKVNNLGTGGGGIASGDAISWNNVTDKPFYEIIELSEDATYIYEHAFYGCESLKSIALDNVTSIWPYAFANCKSLEVMNLPKLTTLMDSAFTGCSKLSTVILGYGRVVSTNSANAANVFTGTPIASGTGSIYVPDASVDSYKIDANWIDLAAVIKPLSEYTG